MISVIMPAYNEENNIGYAINDICMQSNQDFELIIVDDGSEDRTADIVKKHFSNNRDKIIFLQPGKIGKNAAYNLASKYSKGQWFYFMGADDRLPSNAFQLWAEATKKIDPTKKVAIRGRMKVTSINKKYDGLILPKNKKRKNYSGPITLLSQGMHKLIIPIPEKYPNEDNWWSLCIRYFAEKEYLIDDIVVYYSIHKKNSVSRDSSYRMFNEKYHKRYVIREDFIDRFHSMLSCSSINELKSELQCEGFRYDQEPFKVILHKNMSLINKIRALFFSNEKLYMIKVYFDRFFLGH